MVGAKFPAATISSVKTNAGLAASGECVQIGLVLDDGFVAWGEITNLPDAQVTRQMIQQRIAPILCDAPLKSFSNLVDQVDSLTESVTSTRIIEQRPDPKENKFTLSRRQLITGLLAEETVRVEDVVEEMPLHPAVRFGVSQALIHAFAHNQNLTPLNILRAEYHLAGSSTPLSLHVSANEDIVAIVEPVFDTAVAAVAYDISALNPQESLGANAEHLQSHVRNIKAWLEQLHTQALPAIHLNINGGFTDLYGNDAGKILGALYGLEQAAKPYPIVLENIVRGDIASVSTTLQTLQSYLRIRKMDVKLACGYALFMPQALQKLVEETAVQQTYLSVAHFGSVQEIIQFIRACKQADIETIVHGSSGVLDLAVSIALAAQATALSGQPDRLYNAMLQQLA